MVVFFVVSVIVVGGDGGRCGSAAASVVIFLWLWLFLFYFSRQE